MKKLLFIAMVALIGLTACTTTAHSGREQETVPDTAALLQRVDEIYAKVFDAYNNTPIAGIPNVGLDTIYCSRDWNKTMTDVAKHDQNLNGKMGYFEADYWIMGQDWHDLSVSDVTVASMTDSTATVDLNLHNCGSVKPVRLAMVCEDGVWRIDDFIDKDAKYDWKADMKQYLAENP